MRQLFPTLSMFAGAFAVVSLTVAFLEQQGRQHSLASDSYIPPAASSPQTRSTQYAPVQAALRTSPR